jgi:hypothetical protein
VRPAEAGLLAAYGPFRDRGAAEKARAGLHKLIPLRPCDYTFEPDPTLPLGLGCLYAQVRSCAAPCLSRVTEEAYRGLARDAAALLADPAARAAPPAWLPATVGPAEGHGLVVGSTRSSRARCTKRLGSPWWTRPASTARWPIFAGPGPILAGTIGRGSAPGCGARAAAVPTWSCPRASTAPRSPAAFASGCSPIPSRPDGPAPQPFRAARCRKGKASWRRYPGGTSSPPARP